MSLLYCPECSHEVSANAVACPNCGRPISAPPVVERKMVVMPPVEREGGFPTWAFIPIGLLAAILLIVAYLAFRQSEDQANMNVNVNMAGRRASTEANRDTRAPSVPSTSNPTVAVPPGQTTTVPGTTTAAPAAPPSDKGTVVINAQINATDGGPQAARNTKFYLLDKDVETILSEARIEPIEGNTLAGSLGLAAVYPDRYGDFQRNAMRAIAANSKYSGTTGGSGSASLAGIAPNQYYLFAVTRVKNGFALWNSPVSVIPGENILNLNPQSVTEIPDAQ